MPRHIWPAEAETFLIEMLHEDYTLEQGKRKTRQDKTEIVKKMTNERAKENERNLELTADHIIDKIVDSIFPSQLHHTPVTGGKH